MQSIGAAVLLRPVPVRVAGALTALIGVALLCLVTLGHYTRKTHVQGQIAPVAGAIRVVAQQGGTVTAAPRIANGERVRKGQVLFELSSERGGLGGGADARIDVALAERRELLRQELNLQNVQLARRRTSLTQRRQLIVGELERIDQERVLQAGRSRRAIDLRKRYQALRTDGYIAEPKMASVDDDSAEQESRLHALDRARFALDGELLQNRLESAEVSSQMSLNATQSARTGATLEQEIAEHQARARAAVLAPADGFLTAVTTELGQTVQAGTTLATVLPEGGQLEAVLLAPSAAIGLAEKGQSVMLRLSSFPYQKYGQLRGHIASIDNSPVITGQANVGSGAEQLFRIRVQLARSSMAVNGTERLIYPGTEVSGDILQERRTLLAWIVDPIVSATGWRDPAP
jgi:membrane fusion protein